jgi:hypothetical protein
MRRCSAATPPVGPPGVFAIDSKTLSEPAIVDDKGLGAERLRFGGCATRSSTVRMKGMIDRHTGPRRAF